ncbi:MAG: Rrf2 family transcriptional regulator [Eubacteriaceae bacterium]|nr:Rrf2 family transcriptional regulator [Eubacteriaceae bacterium]
MRLSTKGRYGVTAMIHLATYFNKGPVSLKDIAQELDYSEAYMEQLFAALKKERLVASQRGAKGGYSLAKDPSDITVGEIIKALEGPIEFSSCVGGTENFKCKKSTHCVTKEVWEQVNDSINNVIDHITLGDLLKKYDTN